jgi:hypothetical protein
MIGGFYFSDTARAELRYRSSNRNDLEKEYEVLKAFLMGYKVYSEEQIEKEDSIIRNKYTVIVKPSISVPEIFQHRPKTYIGTVSVNQLPEHKVAEARLVNSSGYEIFTSSDDGMIYIICSDNKPGIIEKKGELVLLNSFGKKVKIPFSFSYENKMN